MKLSRELIREAEKLIEVGNYITHVAQALGISRDTFYRWLREGEKAKKGLKREFYEAVKRAEARAIIRNLTIIQKAAQEDWKAAAWFLERKYPEEWGRKDHTLVETGDNGIVFKIIKVERGDEIDDNGSKE